MKTKLIIKDEVNCKFEGLELSTRKKLEKELKFMLPHARHVPFRGKKYEKKTSS